MRKTLRCIAATATLAVVAACGARTDAPVTATIEKADIPGIVNFSQANFSSGFAGSIAGFGGATQPEAMAVLKDRGFATVVNLRLATESGADVDDSRAAAEAAGLKYIHVPFSPSDPAPDVVDDFLAALGNKSNQPVYVHCGSATRAAALWMVARVSDDGLSAEAASEEARAIAAKPDAAVGMATSLLDARPE